MMNIQKETRVFAQKGRRKISTGPVALAFVILVGLAVNPSQFMNYQNLMNIVRQTVTYALLAFGMAFVVISGSIDLSVATVVAMSGYVFAWVMQVSLPLAFLSSIVLGIVVGTINAILIAKIKISPMITTYCMQMFVKGILLIITKGTTYRPEFIHPAVNVLGYGNIFGIVPVGVVLMLLVFFLCWKGIRDIPGIRNVYAVGGNEDAARMMGINVLKTRLTAHILCSVLACLAGINVMARTGAAAASAGDGYDMLAIASIVIGGIVMSGGRGAFPSCLLGALIVSGLTNIFKLQTVLNAYWEKAIIGIVLLLVLLAQVLMTQDIINIKRFKKRL